MTKRENCLKYIELVKFESKFKEVCKGMWANNLGVSDDTLDKMSCIVAKYVPDFIETLVDFYMEYYTDEEISDLVEIFSNEEKSKLLDKLIDSAVPLNTISTKFFDEKLTVDDDFTTLLENLT